MSALIYLQPRDNPEYFFRQLIHDINTNFSAGTSGSGGGSPIQNGLNTYTGGTVSAQTINVSALTVNSIYVSGNSLFDSITATTFYSGNTSLQSILNSISSGSSPDLQQVTNNGNTTTNSVIIDKPGYGGQLQLNNTTDQNGYIGIDFNGDLGLVGQFISSNSNFSNQAFKPGTTSFANYYNGISLVAGAIDGAIEMYANGYAITDLVLTINKTGATYYSDFSPFYVDRSLIDKGYLDIRLSGFSSGFYGWTGGSGAGSIIMVNNTLPNTATHQASLTVGMNNNNSGSYSTIAGGVSNAITFVPGAFIGGGQQNNVVGDVSAIVGGRNNSASGFYGFIGGGQDNTNSGLYHSVIVGGFRNSANNNKIFIGGGSYNYILNPYSSIVGGKSNYVYGTSAFIGGGQTNKNGGYCSVIGGGIDNLLNGSQSVIVGGQKNSATTNHTSILGGAHNLANGYFSIIGGGSYNSINTTYSVIGGGKNNLVNKKLSSILGGYSNKNYGPYSVIGGGYKNKNSSYYSVIAGGYKNTVFVNSSSSSIVGGSNNSATTQYTTVLGGSYNLANGNYSIVSGLRNKTNGISSGVFGGKFNTVNGNYSVILGGRNITATANDTAFVQYLNIQSATTNNLLDNVLVRDTTGEIKIRSLSGITSGITASGNYLPLSGGTVTGNTVFSDRLQVGDIGNETSTININGIGYNSTFKVSDIDGTNFAQNILHRHSTTLEPLIVGARSNSNTTGHTAVTNNMNVFTVYGAGWNTNAYNLNGQISIATDDTGTLSSTSSPGKIVFATTPNLSIWPEVAVEIKSNKQMNVYGDLSAGTYTGRSVKRIVNIASSATPTINTDLTDIARLTGLSTNITSLTTNLTGNPSHGDLFSLELTDNGVARTLTFGSSFSNTGTLSLPTTTVISTLLRCLFEYNSATSKWEIVAVV